MLAGPQVWGPSTNGLRIGISPVISGRLPPVGAQFYVGLQNTGDSDFVVNLGTMLANGQVMFPDAVRLTLTDPAGQIRQLQVSDRRHPVVAGRVDAFTVALRSGATYVLRVSLDQYVSPHSKEVRVKLGDGRHRISARFEGLAAERANLDMQGVAMLNFWKGTVQTDDLEFEVSQLVTSIVLRFTRSAAWQMPVRIQTSDISRK